MLSPNPLTFLFYCDVPALEVPSGNSNSLSRFLPLIATMVACTPRVELSAPPATASQTLRQEAYEQLRPELPQDTSQLDTILVLNSGTEVFHPADLLPVVLSNSDTALQIHAWEVKMRMGIVAFALGMGVMAAGSTMVIADSLSGESVGMPLFVGGLIALVGMVAAISGGLVAVQSGHPLVEALESYEKDLKSRLGLSYEYQSEKNPQRQLAEDPF